MTIDLGDLGAVERAPVDFAFSYFGAPIRVHPDLTDVAIVDMYTSVAEAGKPDTPAVDVIGLFVGALVHPDDADRFRSLARSHRQTVEDVMSIANKLVAAVAQRPTAPPSASAGGRSTTPASSAPDWRSEAIQQLDGRPDAQAGLKRLLGHPLATTPIIDLEPIATNGARA